MNAVVVSGDATRLSGVVLALQNATSALDKDVRKALQPINSNCVFLVIGNKAVIYRRMVEAMTANVLGECDRPLFVCVSYNQAWFLDNRNRMDDAKESTGNRAHVAEFLDVVKTHPWFDLPYDLVVIESAAAGKARRAWSAN